MIFSNLTCHYADFSLTQHSFYIDIIFYDMDPITYLLERKLITTFRLWIKTITVKRIYTLNEKFFKDELKDISGQKQKVCDNSRNLL